MLARTADNRLFLGLLVANALRAEPPLAIQTDVLRANIAEQIVPEEWLQMPEIRAFDHPSLGSPLRCLGFQPNVSRG